MFINSEENEDTEESRKRDWKSEKKSEDSFSNDKHHDSVKTEDESEEKDEGDKSNTKKSTARHAESRYKEVPISNMFCHVCNKHMWDGSVSLKFNSLQLFDHSNDYSKNKIILLLLVF